MSITTVSSDSSSGNSCLVLPEGGVGRTVPVPSRYESQKRRDWNTFGQYLKNHRPPLELSRCSGAHVLEFLRYLDQFGKTKVHNAGCPFFGHPHPPASCPCPLRQAWGSLDALIGRLRAAFEENGGQPEANPFAARAVRLYLREVRDTQAKARGITYEKKKRKKTSQLQKSQQERQPLQGQLQPQHRNQHDHTLHLHHHHHHHQQQQQQQQQQQTIHHHLPLAGDQMGLPSSEMVDLNLDNGGYTNPPHHLFFHGHVLIPPTDAGCHISMPSTAPSNVGTAGNLVVIGGGGGGSGGGGGGGNRSAGSLFSPERLLLCEM